MLQELGRGVCIVIVLEVGCEVSSCVRGEELKELGRQRWSVVGARKRRVARWWGTGGRVASRAFGGAIGVRAGQGGAIAAVSS